MRYALALSTIFLGLCHAQLGNLGLPDCVNGCLGAGGTFGTCSLYDAECICTSDQVIANLACCVSVSCEKADQDTTLQFAEGICGSYDANLPQTATCAPGAQSTPVGSSTGAGAATTGASSTATSGSSSVATTTSSGSGSSASSSASSSAASAASESSASASAAASTGNAAVRNERVESGLGLGLAIAGLIAAI